MKRSSQSKIITVSLFSPPLILPWFWSFPSVYSSSPCTCQCTEDAETSDHFLLHCPNFIEHRRKLFETLNPILLVNNLRDLDDKNLVLLLLYGNKKFKFHENQSILKATINFIRKTSRFSQI